MIRALGTFGDWGRRTLHALFRPRNLDRIFRASLVVKAIDGVLEVAGAFVLFIVGPSSLNSIVAALTQHELVEDPRDALANALTHLVSTVPASTLLFAAAYLLVDGGLKVFLAGALIKKKAWAYVPALIFLSAFIAYQVYRFAYSGSLALIAFASFDTVVALMAWREYARLPRRRGARPARRADEAEGILEAGLDQPSPAAPEDQMRW